MAFPFLIYFVAIEMTAFHVFAAICSTVLVVNAFALTYAHTITPEESGDPSYQRDFDKAKKLKLLFKLVNVVCTILGFMQIFIADHSFDIYYDILNYKKAMVGLGEN